MLYFKSIFAKKNIVKSATAALLATSISMPVMADEAFYDNARVISVAPQTERVNLPLQNCHTEYITETYSEPKSPAGAIIGGIAGGLLGSQIGRGNGRIAGAAVGAGVGAVVGDRVGNDQTGNTTTRPIERCSTVDNWQIVNKVYLVTYQYNGRTFTTVTDSDPGPNIQVRVSVGAVVPPPASLPPARISYADPLPAPVAYPAPVSAGPAISVYGGFGEGRDYGHRGRRENW